MGKDILVKFNLTNEELDLLNRAEIYVNSALKDSHNNRMIDLKDVEIINKNQEATKYVLIGVGITLAVVAAATITVAIVKHVKKKKTLDENPALTLSLKYNTALVKYAKGVKKGKPSSKDISNMMEALGIILKDHETGDVTIELSNKEINTLYGIVYKFTKGLCDAKKIELDDKYALIEFENGDNKIVKIEFIQEMLSIQQTAYA